MVQKAGAQLTRDCYTISKKYLVDIAMPISLRLPTEVETQIASYSARQGLSKSAVIVRSIEEFLAKNAQPSAYDIYLDAMQAVGVKESAAPLEPRSHKAAVQKALRRKHAGRSARASSALKSPSRKAA